MKTSEFKKKVMEMGYRVEIIGSTMFIKGRYEGEFQGMCYFQLENHFQVDITDLKLVKLCIEYAETPIEEREEEKKYIVTLPDPKNDGTHCQALYKGLYGICIGYVCRHDLQGFTEAEIKRNHEYLWQFAKEVAE